MYESDFGPAVVEAARDREDAVYCHLCGKEVGKQNALYALLNPNAAEEHRDSMREEHLLREVCK